ncbi:restriction endonuclease subunit S [Lactococcus petauri]|uniref:restriction endonuclease subunit S n=1 Tax=Lactococcus petauri TaxID=1940789 RepID=UPI001FAE8D65|nr:restriction endonuclease subunit S [Lactococcus petauri]
MAKIDDSVKKKVPELRFKGFTDDWEERKLGDLGSVAMNKRIFKEQTSDVGDIPFYKIGTFGGTPDAFISRDIFEEYKSKYQYPEVGDILISASGSIGRTVVYRGDDEYFQDSNIVWLKHDQQLDNSFLKQFYSIVKWQGLEGSTIKRLYNKNILETKITLPSPEEQAQLGSFFKQLDNTIALHQHKLDLLKEQKKGYLQKMFPKNGEKIPELRFAGFADDWEECKLGEVATLSSSKRIHLSDYVTEGIPFYRGSEISTGGITGNQELFISQEKFDEIKEKYGVPSEGDILVTAVGTLGNLWKVDSRRFYYKDGNLIQISKMQVNSDYLLTYFTGGIGKKRLLDSAAGSNQKALTMVKMREITVDFPSEDEQKKVGAFFKSLDDTIALHQRKLDLLKEQKKGFLQKMFV